MKRHITRISIIILLIVTALVASGFNVGFDINANGFLSIGTADISVNGKAKAAGIYDEDWGYELILDNGDIVQIGDNTTEDFKAKVTTIRNLNQNIYFSIGWLGGTFEPSVDNMTVSFDFNSSTHVDIYPVPPDERLPEGGIEYDITLDKKPAKPTVTLDIDWSGITWTKIYGLDVEYTEQDCIENWGDIYTDFYLSPTEITGILIETQEREVVKYRPEYEVNSYLGTAIEATDVAQGEGDGALYNRISRTYLYIHRGQMIDALGATDWIDDIWLDEENKTLTFELDSVWLRNAEYPVSHVCGVDPAYSEEMLNSQTSMSDDTWTETDLNTEFSLNLGTTNVVLEMMLENQQKGTENLIGVRDTSSSLSRYINLHEAEPTGGGAGDTHCRMFVQTITNGSSQQAIDMYSEDVSDTWFYILGYWENVSFTENEPISSLVNDYQATWTEDNGHHLQPNCVHHLICWNYYDDEWNYVGVRSVGSSLNRRVKMHEAESGGKMMLDFLVKADGDGDYEYNLGNGSSTYAFVYDFGYFSSELDFVELWQSIPNITADAAWQNKDLSAYLDEDGRVVDVLMVHDNIADYHAMGVRDGDDSTTSRYLWEHEAEDNGGSTGELTGFSMSAVSNSSGEIGTYQDKGFGANNALFYLTGYFLPAGGGPTYNITNEPDNENLGIVLDGHTYYAYGSAPSNPVQNGECTFTISNSGDSCDIDMKITDFTGGTTWNIVSGSPSTNEVRVTAYYSGQDPASGLVLANTDAEFYDGLASSSSIKWDFKFETGDLANENEQHSATITVTAVAED